MSHDLLVQVAYLPVPISTPDDDDDGDAQHGGHSPKKTYSLGLLRTSLILDI